MKSIKPNAKQQSYMDLKYGMFLHFRLTTFEGEEECGSGKCPVERFCPTELDIPGWARLAKESGMNYAVLTAKHVDGFCLWSGKYTEYSVKNTPHKTDIVREFVNEFRNQGLKVGLYYALWDRNYPDYANDGKYAAYMRNQIKELLTEYGEILELWFDGGWNKEHPTGDWMYESEWEKDNTSGLRHGEAWEWDELCKLIHELQPHCMIGNNASSDRPGAVKYFPLDLRIAERSDYICRDQICRAVTDPAFTAPGGETVCLPLEYCNTLTPNWFYRKDRHVLHPSVATIVGWYRQARESHANLLLNVGPDCRGKIPEYHLEYLKGAARELGINTK